MLWMHTKVSRSLKTLSNLCLEASGHNGYTDRDFVNACAICAHVFADVIWTENSTTEQSDREQVIIRSGRAIREIIHAATGRDMNDIAGEAGSLHS